MEKRGFKIFALSFAILILFASVCESQEELETIETNNVDSASPKEQAQPKLTFAESIPNNSYIDPVRYTLGPDDVVEIIVMRHPEFSGTYPINLEGKIQYKFVGDIEVTGLTKKELEEKIKEIISGFVINPEVNVTILEYRSKVIYVLGEVGRPGKYYMRSETIPVREAVVEAGLPTLAAAMRRCRIVTPDKDGKAKTRTVDLYAILYSGNLKYNLEMRAGDVLYVPATIMAKLVRVINPVTAPISSLNSGESAATTLATRPR